MSEINRIINNCFENGRLSEVRQVGFIIGWNTINMLDLRIIYNEILDDAPAFTTSLANGNTEPGIDCLVADTTKCYTPINTTPSSVVCFFFSSSFRIIRPNYSKIQDAFLINNYDCVLKSWGTLGVCALNLNH